MDKTTAECNTHHEYLGKYLALLKNRNVLFQDEMFVHKPRPFFFFNLKFGFW